MSTVRDIWIRRVTATLDSDGPAEADFVCVAAGSDVLGIWGPISMPQSSLILLFLRDRLIGRKLEEALHETAMAARGRHATGMFAMACAACDLALWDALGRQAEIPCYRLLGEPLRDGVRCYASLLAVDLMETIPIDEIRGLGARYWGLKFAARLGPDNGPDGRRRTIDALARLSDGCGRLMVDALCGWTQEHALAFIVESETLGLAWIEEPLPADDLAGYRRIARVGTTPIAAGEHAYSVDDALGLIDCGVRVLQPDAGWCGGLRAFDSIVRCATRAGVPVVPHGGGLLPALHVALHHSVEAVPALEYHLSVEPRRQHFWRTKFLPDAGGTISAPRDPGLGIELDEDSFSTMRDFTTLEWARA